MNKDPISEITDHITDVQDSILDYFKKEGVTFSTVRPMILNHDIKTCEAYYWALYDIKSFIEDEIQPIKEGE